MEGCRVHSARTGPTGHQGMGRQGLNNSGRGWYQEQDTKQACEPVPVDGGSLWQVWEGQITAENEEWGRKVPNSVNC